MAPRMRQITGDVDFDIDKIPDQSGKVVFITGGTAGLGLQSVRAFARHGASHIYFTGRNRRAADDLIADLSRSHPRTRLSFVEMDMMSLSSVKRAVNSCFGKKQKHDDDKNDDDEQGRRLDVLVCNAGIMDKPPALSADGFEVHMAVNHLAHAMVVRELMGTLERTATEVAGSSEGGKGGKRDVRIVVLTSMGYAMAPAEGVTFDTLRTDQGTGFMERNQRYGQSKLANILFARRLSRLHPSITTVAVHPGVVATDLIGSLPPLRRCWVKASSYLLMGALMSEEVGCLSQLWCATMGSTPDEEGTGGEANHGIKSGGFYMPIGVLADEGLRGMATDEKLEGRLWEWTEEVLRGF